VAGGAIGVAGVRQGDDVIDQAEILKLVDRNLPLLEEIVALFLDESPRVLAQIHTAVCRGDATQLQLAAHGMRGTVSVFRASAACEAARILEEMGRTGDLTGAAEGYATLEEALQRLRRRLLELVAELAC
jgi:HPt (histidine-containing phosphotransfer) domain-containing protein